ENWPKPGESWTPYKTSWQGNRPMAGQWRSGCGLLLPQCWRARTDGAEFESAGVDGGVLRGCNRQQESEWTHPELESWSRARILAFRRRREGGNRRKARFLHKAGRAAGCHIRDDGYVV